MDLQNYKTDNAYILKWAKKILCANRLGGKCSDCGTNNILVLQFHHKDGATKEFDICAERGMNITKLFEEADKCMLLCSNCHAEKHQEERGTDVVLRRRETKKALLDYKRQYKCQKCDYSGKNYASLDFHHTDPKKKEIKPIQEACIHGLTDKVCDELDKCEVICKNCHVQEHIKLDKFNNLKEQINDKVKNYVPYNKQIDTKLISQMLLAGNTDEQIKIATNCKDSNLYYWKKKLGLLSIK